MYLFSNKSYHGSAETLGFPTRFFSEGDVRGCCNGHSPILPRYLLPKRASCMTRASTHKFIPGSTATRECNVYAVQWTHMAYLVHRTARVNKYSSTIFLTTCTYPGDRLTTCWSPSAPVAFPAHGVSFLLVDWTAHVVSEHVVFFVPGGGE